MTRFIVVTCLDDEADEIKSIIVDRLLEAEFEVQDSSVVPGSGNLVYYTTCDIADHISKVTALTVNQELGDEDE